MIYRCTARFVKSYDQLSPEAKAKVGHTLRHGFSTNPRMPTADTHIVRGAVNEIYTLHVGDNLRMTFAYCSDLRHPHKFVCVLRNVGMGSAG